MKTNRKGTQMPREMLETAAYTVGPHSAAAAALKDADAHDGPVEFWNMGRSIVVVKLPKEVVHDEIREV